ncbi:AcrR family transcriptional regulator [Crossiella equi]|uniref:AcrR family transcriptional regulator n=1 Tax=Crossiella equi TaxID=130796 RepID=A0ABS5A4I9_9PSEU|nr:TetR/AcrR family transcriptional regulator [Crossiella equi]MBP2471463.1 AcrR family transcriptional regulator [Crossiella equi]
MTARSEPVPTEQYVPERLVEAATTLFAEKGYQATSVQEIADAAGVTKGGLYHYFKSKAELLHEVYRRLLFLQTYRLEGIAAGEGPATARLRAAAQDVVVTSAGSLREVTVFFREMHHLPPTTLATVRAERRRYHERFRGLVEEGQATGEFRADLSADLVTHSFFGAIHHLAVWYRPTGPKSAAEIAADFTELLLSSLRPLP